MEKLVTIWPFKNYEGNFFKEKNNRQKVDTSEQKKKIMDYVLDSFLSLW